MESKEFEITIRGTKLTIYRFEDDKILIIVGDSLILDKCELCDFKLECVENDSDTGARYVYMMSTKNNVYHMNDNELNAISTQLKLPIECLYCY